MFPPSTKSDDLSAALHKTSVEAKLLSGLLESWTRSGNDYPDLGYFSADRGEFVNPPFNVIDVELETTQTITSGAWNTVVFNHTVQNVGGIIGYSTASTGLFQLLKPSNGRVFLVFGQAHWASTAGTYRSIKIESYPSTEEITFSRINGDEIAQPFIAFYRVPQGTTGFGIRVYEEQPVSLGRMSFGAWEIARV